MSMHMIPSNVNVDLLRGREYIGRSGLFQAFYGTIYEKWIDIMV